MRIPTLLVALLGLLLVGCETTDSVTVDLEKRKAPTEDELDRFRAAYLDRIHVAEAEVHEIMHTLMEKAVDYHAAEMLAYTGSILVTEDFYPSGIRQNVREEGIGPYISILSVRPDSPAESAGLRPGDKLVSINGKKVPRGTGVSGANQASIFAVKRVKRLLKPEEANTLGIERDGNLVEVQISPRRGVSYELVVMAGADDDLHVDGDVIWMSLDRIEELRGTDDLAYFCAFAIAKSVMHQPKLQGRREFFGELLDVAAIMSGFPIGGRFGQMAAGMHRRAFEVEADLVAMYLLASADFKFREYPDFWENEIGNDSEYEFLTEPEQERIDIAQRVVASISQKLEAGETIFPKEYLAGDASEISEPVQLEN